MAAKRALIPRRFGRHHAPQPLVRLGRRVEPLDETRIIAWADIEQRAIQTGVPGSAAPSFEQKTRECSAFRGRSFKRHGCSGNIFSESLSEFFCVSTRGKKVARRLKASPDYELRSKVFSPSGATMSTISDRLYLHLGQLFEGAAEGRFAIGALVFAFSLIAIIVAIRLFRPA